MALFPKGLMRNFIRFWRGRVACMHFLTQEEPGWISSWQWLISSRIWRGNICSSCMLIESQEAPSITTFPSLFLQESNEQARPTLSIDSSPEKQAVNRIARPSDHCSFCIVLFIFTILIKEQLADGEASVIWHLSHRGKPQFGSFLFLL